MNYENVFCKCALGGPKYKHVWYAIHKAINITTATKTRLTLIVTIGSTTTMTDAYLSYNNNKIGKMNVAVRLEDTRIDTRTTHTGLMNTAYTC